MPRRKNHIPKMRHHTHSNRALVVFEGKDYWLGRWESPEADAEYRRLVAIYLVTGRPPERTARRRPASTEGKAINELVLAYNEFAKRTLSKGTRAGSIKPAMRRMRRLYGPTRVADFMPRDLRVIQQTMTTEIGRGGRPLSRRYINAQIQRMRHILRWGVTEGIVPTTVWHGTMAITGIRRGAPSVRDTPPVRPVADELIEATLPYLSSVVADMVRVHRLTGMRPGELCAMRWCDVQATGEVWQYHPEHHKNTHRGLDRCVPLGPRAQAILMRYRSRPDNAPVFAVADAEAERATNLRADRATPLTPSQRRRDERAAQRRRRDPQWALRGFSPCLYGWTIRRAAKQAGLPHWTPNQLRHTKATELRAEMGLDAAGAVLGHARIETTQIYAERSQHLAMEAAKKTG